MRGFLTMAPFYFDELSESSLPLSLINWSFSFDIITSLKDLKKPCFELPFNLVGSGLIGILSTIGIGVGFGFLLIWSATIKRSTEQFSSSYRTFFCIIFSISRIRWGSSHLSSFFVTSNLWPLCVTCVPTEAYADDQSIESYLCFLFCINLSEN